MSKTILHIGTPKTGTTYLQLALNINKEQLWKAGWNVLNAGSVELEACEPNGLLAGHTICHHRLAWALQGDRPLPFGVSGIVLNDVARDAVLEFSSNANFIISSECLYWEIRDISAIKTLKDILPRNVEIVIWLRNRWDFIDSMFTQAVYDHGTMQTVLEYVDENLSFFDYGAALSQWSTVFGYENIKIIYYDSSDNSFISFLENIGINVDNLELPDVRINSSVPKFLIPILQSARLDRARHLHLSDSAKRIPGCYQNKRLLELKDIAKISKSFRSGDLFLQQFGINVAHISDPVRYLEQDYIYEMRLDNISDELGKIISAIM